MLVYGNLISSLEFIYWLAPSQKSNRVNRITIICERRRLQSKRLTIIMIIVCAYNRTSCSWDLQAMSSRRHLVWSNLPPPESSASWNCPRTRWRALAALWWQTAGWCWWAAVSDSISYTARIAPATKDEGLQNTRSAGHDSFKQTDVRF